MWKHAKKVFTIASAFIGVIVGAGFASGQEILLYFTSYGYVGLVGILVATILFAYLGMSIIQIGSLLKTQSHKEAIYMMGGPWLGLIIDVVMTLALFGVGVVMIAGAGSLVEQQWDMPFYIGSLCMTGFVMFSMTLNVNKVIALIGGLTPFLFVIIIISFIYSLMTMDVALSELNLIAKSQPSAVSHWFLSSINYVSSNIAVGAGMALVMGGAEKNYKLARLGGLIGGLGIGLLIMFAHVTMFLHIPLLVHSDMPLLMVIDDISPLLGSVMAIIMFGMIFNTAISLFYAFVARFFNMDKETPYIPIMITCVIGFIGSFAGFKNLVRQFYPLIGFAGCVLIIVLIMAPYRLKKM